VWNEFNPAVLPPAALQVLCAESLFKESVCWISTTFWLYSSWASAFIRTDVHGQFNLLAFIVPEIVHTADGWPDRPAVDPNQECIYFIWSEKLPSACYMILFNESSITFFTLRVTGTFILRVTRIFTRRVAGMGIIREEIRIYWFCKSQFVILNS